MFGANQNKVGQQILERTRRLLAQSLEIERRLEQDGAALSTRLATTPSIGDGVTGKAGRRQDAAGSPSTAFLIACLSEIQRLALSARELRHLWEQLIPMVTAEGTSRPQPQPHVLVVDDSQDTCELISMMLKAAEFDVVAAHNGLEGLIAAHDHRPAVILMDLNMPVLDGLEATRLLKAARRTRHIPVIAHTARPAACGPEHLFAEVLTKPTEPGMLLASVHRYTRTR